MTLYPYGYDKEMVSFETLVQRSRQHEIHPEYDRRLFNWIRAQNGVIGIGSGWRNYNNDVSGASSQNKSFHQTQTFQSGLKCYSAVDLVAINPGHVHRAPRWDEVPEQGGSDAKKWGVHCNVNGEPWHMQCIEMDGFDSWVNGGRKDPQANYPIPGTDPAPKPKKGKDMIRVDYGYPGVDNWWTRMLIGGCEITWVQGHANDELDELIDEHIQVKDDQHMVDILSTYRATHPVPSTFATNATLVDAWEISRHK